MRSFRGSVEILSSQTITPSQIDSEAGTASTGTASSGTESTYTESTETVRTPDFFTTPEMIYPNVSSNYLVSNRNQLDSHEDCLFENPSLPRNPPNSSNFSTQERRSKSFFDNRNPIWKKWRTWLFALLSFLCLIIVLALIILFIEYLKNLDLLQSVQNELHENLREIGNLQHEKKLLKTKLSRIHTISDNK